MNPDRLADVTELEREALRLLYDGLTAKEIGQKLGISDRTVYQRQTRASHKLGVRKPIEAARIVAVDEGRRPPAEIAHQSPHLAEMQSHPQHWLLQLLIPEANGRTINDLTIGQRALVILVRAALIILMLVALAAVLAEMSIILRHPS